MVILASYSTWHAQRLSQRRVCDLCTASFVDPLDCQGSDNEKNSTIITSNKSFADWTELFHDPIIITAILDRLLHHSTVINIKGNSYRLKGKPITLSDSLTESNGE